MESVKIVYLYTFISDLFKLYLFFPFMNHIISGEKKNIFPWYAQGSRRLQWWQLKMNRLSVYKV